MKDDKVNGDGGIMDWGKLQKENEKLRKEVAEVGAKKDGEILIGANIILKLELQVASLTEQLAEAKKWWNKFEEGYGEALEQLAAIKENKVTALATERARGEKLLKGLGAVVCLIEESYGVVGLHLNGDTATWHELRTGGQYEDWLEDFDTALEIAEETK